MGPHVGPTGQTVGPMGRRRPGLSMSKRAQFVEYGPFESLLSQRDRESSLENRVFDHALFYSFVVYPTLGTSAIVADVQLLSCRVSPGTCQLGPGLILRRVLFSDFECGDAMHIDAAVELDGVIVRGSRPRRLWIRPYEASAARVDSQPQLDITGYLGEVSITGVGTSRLRLDPTRHVVVRADWLQTVDWQGLGLSPLSFWRIAAKKVAVEQSVEGVFSVPKSGSRRAAILADLGLLRRAGVVGAAS